MIMIVRLFCHFLKCGYSGATWEIEAGVTWDKERPNKRRGKTSSAARFRLKRVFDIFHHHGLVSSIIYGYQKKANSILILTAISVFNKSEVISVK